MVWLRALLVVLGLSVFLQVQARLTIQISQGVDQPYPVAVVPFSDNANQLAPYHMTNGLSGVISNDLHMSGRFALMPTAAMPSRPHALKAFNWSEWHHVNSNLEYVLIGKLTPTGKAYTVSYELISMLGGKPLAGEVYHNIAGSQLRALAHHISDKVYYAITGQKGIFSTRLAYVEVTNPESKLPMYQLMVSDADGYSPKMLIKQVGKPIASPVWSPDGRKLAYVSYLHHRMTVYAITLATGKREVIASYPGMNSAPAWSPDGKKMALALSKGNSSRTNLYVMELASKKLTKLTTFGNNTSPSWSPDGKHIAFNSNRGGSPQIYQLNLATRQVSRVTYQGVQNFDPVYTPNGKHIALMTQAYSGGPIHIAKVDLSNDRLTALTTGRLDKSPSVSPNGQMIVYANYDRKHGVLAETSIDGKIHLTLPATRGTVQSPAWSPYLT